MARTYRGRRVHLFNAVSLHNTLKVSPKEVHERSWVIDIGKYVAGCGSVDV
jgi:hypothetical protein